MKKKDLALIAVIVVVSAVASILLSKAVIESPKNRQQSVEVVQAISSEFPKADSRYFNKDSIDPTKIITIGENANPEPFNGSSR